MGHHITSCKTLRFLCFFALLMQTKFKSRGKKAGAIAGWKLLKESGLASLVEFKAQRGTDKVILQLYVCTHV